VISGKKRENHEHVDFNNSPHENLVFDVSTEIFLVTTRIKIDVHKGWWKGVTKMSVFGIILAQFRAFWVKKSYPKSDPKTRCVFEGGLGGPWPPLWTIRVGGGGGGPEETPPPPPQTTG